MKKPGHKKKMIAPVVITVLFLACLAVYAVTLFRSDGWRAAMILPGLSLIALGAGMVYTLKTRIDEIRSGEEDDLDNY